MQGIGIKVTAGTNQNKGGINVILRGIRKTYLNAKCYLLTSAESGGTNRLYWFLMIHCFIDY
jgi:hypothetical protein